MTFKENLQRRIEKDCVRSELKGEVVYLKKSKIPFLGDWSRIYPPINEDGSINWINLIFGGKRNLIKLIIYFGIAIFVLLALKEAYNNVNVLLNNACVQSCINILN